MVDPVTVGSLVLESAKNILNLGDKLYSASQEWAEFPRQVELLQGRLQFWERQLGKPRMGVDKGDERVLEILEVAKAQLDKEADRLVKRREGGFRKKLGFFAKSVAFPSKIGQSIQRAINAFDEISKALREEDEAASLSENRVLRKPLSPNFMGDKLYVPLIITEYKVRMALEDSSSPTLVLLHGGPGLGKTSVARQMAVHYNQNNYFSQIHFLECGPGVDISRKEVELLHMLGSHLGDVSENIVQNHKKLHTLLRKHENIVIILDDVFDSELVKIIVEGCDAKVKCLVTSQKPHLFDSFDKTAIEIQDLHMEDAQKILASHGGFGDHRMPHNLEMQFEKLIRMANKHPWVLATIANSIDKDRNGDKNEWNAAIEHVLFYMRSEEKVSNYPKIYWATMCSLVESLTLEARKLLVLLFAFEELSVHEEIVMLLYESIAGFDRCTKPFRIVKTELQKKGWLKILPLETDGKKHHMWSLHSLQKTFIEEAMKDTIESVLKSLLDAEIESNCRSTSSITAAVFFDTSLAGRLTENFDISLDTLRQRRSCVLTIILHLLHPIYQEDNTSAKITAKQVLKHYLQSGRLDEVAISKLSENISTAARVLDVLYKIVSPYRQRRRTLLFRIGLLGLRLEVVIPDPPSIVRICLDIVLEHSELAYSNTRVLDTLFGDFSYSGNLSLILSCPLVIERIIRLLVIENDFEYYTLKLRIIRFLSAGSRRCARVLVENSRLLEALVKFCDSVSAVGSSPDPGLFRLFYELAENEDVRTILKGTPGLIDSLVRLWSRASIAHRTEDEIEGVRCFTFIDPKRGNQQPLTSAKTYQARGQINLKLGLVSEGRDDLDNAVKLGAKYAISDLRQFNKLSFSRARLGDFEGALLYRNICIEQADRGLKQMYRFAFYLRERGILKRLMGDLDGALTDLNESVDVLENDYEVLKHRGYVKFLMGDEDGARADAERAIEFKPSRVDDRGYNDEPFLGAYPVEFMVFKLR